jgi:dolichyl-phosphate beta-glucosyltransferase
LREEHRIGKTLDELAQFLKKNEDLSRLSVEVLVVAADGGDATAEVVLKKQKKFKNLTLLQPGAKVGKGRDVKYGMLRATGKCVLFMDADLATPLRHIPKFYKACSGGSDIVIGVRNLLKHHPSLGRRLISKTGNLLFRVAGGVWVEDSQCGFKVFNRRANKICFSRLQLLHWGFDMEVLAIARANKLKIKTYRISDWVSVEEGSFVDDTFKNAIHSLGDLGSIMLRRISGVYRRPTPPDSSE